MRRQMRYYYLDNEKKPQGPYTVEEMNSFLNSGLISEDTLIASAGESTWKSLSSVFAALEEVKSSTWNKHEFLCPYCKHSLSSDSHLCAHCGKSLYCPRKGLFATFFYVIKNSFNYKGRAGRREFWLFYLTYFLFYMFFSWLDNHLSQPVIFDSESIDDSNVSLSELSNHMMNSYTDVILSSSFISIYCLLMLFPFLAVSVRRLHDIGISAAPVVVGSISYIIGTCSVFAFLCNLPDTSFEVIKDAQFIDIKLVVYSLLVLLSYLCFFLTSIFLLICMFIPGHTGINQYGPAPLSK